MFILTIALRNPDILFWKQSRSAGYLITNTMVFIYCIIVEMELMRGSRNLRQGGPGQSDKKNLFLVLSLYYRSQMVNVKENYRFSRGSNIFQGGGGGNFFQGGGVQLLIHFRNQYNLWFSRRSGPPVPIWTRTWNSRHIRDIFNMKFRHLSHRRAATAQLRLRISAVISEPWLLAYTEYGSRRRHRQRGTYICVHAWIFFKLCLLITQHIQTMKIYLLN